MFFPTALSAISALVSARSAGDVDTTVSCYETGATIVAQPGTVLNGADGVRAAVHGFLALQPTFNVTARTVVEGNGVALHHSAWTMTAIDDKGDPFEMSGCSSDVLRQQDHGGWLIAIDNPFGAAMIDDIGERR